MSTLSDRLPADRRFEFASTACPSDTFAVVRMSGFEAISRPYRFELVLVCDDAQLDLARVLAAKAELRILAPDGSQQATPYAGVLAEFDQLHQAGGFTFYRAVLVPRLWQLSLYRSSEVYLHEQTIPEIVEAMLKSARFSPASDYAFKLTGSYRPRSYVCQYQETPLAFISRWLEREGIYYHFEQVDGVERLVLLDDKVAQPAAAVTVNYRPADALDVGLAPDSIQGFVCRTRPLPRSLVLQDYNHRRASMPLLAQVEVSASGIGEEMLYGENFRTEEEGQRYAKIRAQELRCGERVFSGEGTAVGLRSGCFMDLSHHYRDDFNGRYLVTEITHEGSQAGALLAGLKTPFDAHEGHTSYRNTFLALPAATQFRPARITPKPRVAGTMNATIDAEGSGEYAELDAYGQYKVQIPFDRTEKGAAKGSAPVRMASPYAGSDHGMHFPLHKGAEVLLSFTDGDPDQPVIVGAVPNSENPSVVDSRNPRLSMIQTKGGNEIGFDDTKGKEAVWLRSPYQDSALIIGFPRPAPPAPPAPTPPPGFVPVPVSWAPVPPVTGNIFQATKGGSDSVSFGNSNSMSFGSSSSLSLGTSASLSAAIGSAISIGMNTSIGLSNSVSWNMNLVPWTDAVKSISIDDSDSVSHSVNAGTTAMQQISFSAGADPLDVSALNLETELKVLRGLIGAFTAGNLAQSTIFGMAVNGSGDNLLVMEADKKEKARKDAESAQKKRDDDRAKQANLDALDKKWAGEHAKDADAIDALEKKSPRSNNENVKLNALKEKRESDLFADKTKIAKRYNDHDAGRTSPMLTNGFMGWPGILGKFGADALGNVAAMGILQHRAQALANKIKALKPTSKMTLDSLGIEQTVSDNSGRLPVVTGSIRLGPTTGLDITSASVAIESKASATLTAAVQASVNAPTVHLGVRTAGAPSVSISSTEIALRSSANVDRSVMSLKNGESSFTASKIFVGRAARIPDPTRQILVQQFLLADDAYQKAHQAAQAARKEWEGEQLTVKKTALELIMLAADKVAGAARKARTSIDDQWVLQQQNVSGTVLSGLHVEAAKTELTYASTSVKTAADGITLTFGASTFVVNAAGLSGAGPLIKLG